ncbi:MAG: TIGR03085 family metal-binding protein [Actinomycetes bacterium]
MSIASFERRALADLLLQVGPDAATLCTGWTTRDLAAHLAVRERRMDAAAGLALSPLAGHLESVTRTYAERPYDELVRYVRSGPPRWSGFALPGADRLLNTTEYFVHHEDVRRAQPGWEPRTLPAAVQDGLWSAVKGRAALAFRGTACGVTLSRPDGQTITAVKGDPAATLRGEPAELLLYLFGRRTHARVEVTGSPEALAALAQASLEV